MGGIGRFIAVEEAELAPGKRRASIEALHAALTDSLLKDIARQVRSDAAYTPLVDQYLPIVASTAAERGLWRAAEGQLGWLFPDYGGLCLVSSLAAEHLLSRSLDAFRARWDRLLGLRGWRFASPPPPPAQQLLHTGPLTDSLDGLLCLVPPLAPGRLDHDGPMLRSDGSRPPMAIGAVRDGLRHGAYRVAMLGLCDCRYCRDLAWKIARSGRSEAVAFGNAWLVVGQDPALRALAASLAPAARRITRWGRLDPALAPLVRALDPPASGLSPLEAAALCVRVADHDAAAPGQASAG